MTWKEPAIVVTSGGTILGGLTQELGPNDWVRTQTSFVGPATFSGRTMMGLRRSAQGSAGYVEDNLGDFPGFHDLIDPATARRRRGFEMCDWVVNVIAVGACSYAWGIHDYTTANDPATLVGLGFEHGSDYILKTFLRDMPGGVGNRVVHQTVLSSLASALHELRIVVDGWTKQIKWMVDGAVVDTYTPAVALDQTGGSSSVLMQKFRYRGFVPTSGDMTIYRSGGGVSGPILTLRESGPAT